MLHVVGQAAEDGVKGNQDTIATAKIVITGAVGVGGRRGGSFWDGPGSWRRRLRGDCGEVKATGTKVQPARPLPRSPPRTCTGGKGGLAMN